MKPEMITTAFELEGYKTVKNLGIVRGIKNTMCLLALKGEVCRDTRVLDAQEATTS